jgi:hypothetical protein
MEPGTGDKTATSHTPIGIHCYCWNVTHQFSEPQNPNVTAAKYLKKSNNPSIIKTDF